MRLVNKKFKSIDGFFNNSLNSIKVRDIQNIRNKNLCIVGRGNSISAIPFDKKSNIITQNNKNLIKLNKKKLEIFVDGNINVNLIINFLNKKKLFFPSFPSISNIKLGACIANCVHGHNPKIGTIRKFIKEIKLYNPNFGIKILTPKKNKKLFDLTIGGMGMTGLILSAKLKVFKLKSSFIKIEKEALFFNLYSLYKYLFSSKFIFNQNNFFINYSKKKLFTCRVISGNFLKKNFNLKKLK